MRVDHKLSTVDYLVFATALILSLGVGVFHAWKAGRRKKKDDDEKLEKTNDFLIGGRKLPVLPVSLSLMTTFVSGFTLLGVPAEIYQRGMLMWVYQMMGVPALAICAILFLPIFYKIQPISIYQYFELRFGSRLIRQAAAVLFLLNTVFYMSVVMYAPAVALSGVTDVPTWPFILSVGAVCTLYTTIGGIRTVIWTDTLQSIFMYGGVFALLIKGTIDAGGMARVWQINSDSGRFQVLANVDPSPTQYFSIWIALFGGLSFWMSLYGLNQMAVQRYCALPSLRQAYYVMAITTPAFMIIIAVAAAIGLVMVAYFWECDPLESGLIKTPDQLVILFVTRTLGSLNGLPGLFIACLFSGTLRDHL